MKNKISFYYFTGTGNTLNAVVKMKALFERSGISVTLNKIERSDPSKIDLSETIGIAFPVAAMSTFPFVLDFLHALPNSNGTEIFMLDTFAGSSGAIAGPLKKLLTSKGYKCIGAKEIQMPCNIFYIFSDKTNNKLIENGIKSAEDFAQDIIDGKSRWKRIPFLFDIMSMISGVLLLSWKIRWGQKLFAFSLNKEKCTKCGICAKICPVGNIIMEDYPSYQLKCQYCLRCASFCPEKALTVPFNFKNKTFKSINVKELLE